ncbi:MAG: tryptophan--tRNA ligase [Gammaproteobacteria bacterium TMED226]|nr:MAG: tryptophan--tRNA ligase [Gammaproteobacteria bacterium TMED226]|tara:strand:+ start:7463 stop:8455 length:993 start_codon:yes stop_codon:yes gene_type:complete
MKKRILTGITTTGLPHIGNYIGAIKPALEFAKDSNDSYFFLADYHSIIKNNKPSEISSSVENIALAWLSCGLDTNSTYFYRQSDVPEILELSWILNCITAKGLMNRSHAYKAATALNNDDIDKGITMGLFSYPILMAADILMFDSTHVPVGPDQIQHLEMTRDIAARFNHLYKPIFTLPEPIIHNEKKVVPGLDGRKMSKSYGNVIPLLESEKKLRKSIMKIVTNSLEPGEPKDFNDCTLFELYQHFANEKDVLTFKQSYKDGISWGEAKEILFNAINQELKPVREKHSEYIEDKGLINDLLNDGAKKARVIAKEKISKIREVIGIKDIS